MTILPLDPAANATPEALRAFLAQCRAAAAGDGQPRLASISIEVPPLDPLAVLESIFEPAELHFYAERPAEDWAVAGAEAVLTFEASGPDRFAAGQRFVDEVLARTIAVGETSRPFGGPHFFGAYSFFDEVEAGEPFPAVRLFVPRWQVSRAHDRTIAVANLLVDPDADLDALVAKVWRAHGKFRAFEYGEKGGTGVSPVGLGGTGVSPVGLGGTGVSPVGLGLGGTGVSPVGFGGSRAMTCEMGPVEVRQGAYLPHWTREGGICAVTFRLVDSLPASVVLAWREERESIVLSAAQQGRLLSPAEVERLDRLNSDRVEAYLDTGVGACWLKSPEIAAVVAGALAYFDGERYELHEWCVMPNHVHAFFRPLAGHSLDGILHSWKSYTAKEANRLLGRKGDFWQSEYYDHLIRDEADYARVIDYVRCNPGEAKLKDLVWCGSGTGASAAGVEWHGQPARGKAVARASRPWEPLNMGGTPMPQAAEHGQDAHATPAAEHGRDGRATYGRDTHATADVYRAAVARAVAMIEEGRFEKIVLARCRELTAAGALHPLKVLNALRQRFPDCYAFSFANGRGQSFIGASPERLLRVEQGTLLTEALAGSAPRGRTASEDAALGGALLGDDKELREHRHVVASIDRRLAPLGLRMVHAALPGLRRLANVQHLHTPVSAALPAGVRLLDVLARLHPTPAVGGSPRVAACAHIRELEGFSRGLYGGPVGWLDHRGGGEFLVGIRSALIDGARARAYAGGGIVAGSDPDRELAETDLKFKALLEALVD